jgi:hypothetical protein
MADTTTIEELKLRKKEADTVDYFQLPFPPHCKENPNNVFLFCPNFHNHVSVSDLYVYSQNQSTYFPATE